MNCKTAQQQLSAYVDRELSPDEQFALRAHLAECMSCREEEHELRVLKSLLGGVGTPEPAPDFAERLTRKLREEQRPIRHIPLTRKWMPALLYGAVAATAMLATLAFINPGRSRASLPDDVNLPNVAFEVQRDQTAVSAADPLGGAPVLSAVYGR
jgi:anti-sigma factor RsiW